MNSGSSGPLRFHSPLSFFSVISRALSFPFLVHVLSALVSFHVRSCSYCFFPGLKAEDGEKQKNRCEASL